jgi:hypothetical protein
MCWGGFFGGGWRWIFDKARMFFFEKKNQKTFESWAEPIRRGRSQYAKVFCFFFSKKKSFFILTQL